MFQECAYAHTSLRMPRFLPDKMLSRCFSHSQPSRADDSPLDSVGRLPVQHLSRLQRAGESGGLPRCRNGRRLYMCAVAIRRDDCGSFSTLFRAMFVRTVAKSAPLRPAATQPFSCSVGARGGPCNRFVSKRRESTERRDF